MPLDSANTKQSAIDAQLKSLLQSQRVAFMAEGSPSAAVRAARIDKLMLLLLENVDALTKAMNEDFGNRSCLQSIATDVFGIYPSIKHTRKYFKRWMRPERVSAGLIGLSGGKAWVQRQPLGVVGIISPWNFPVALAIQPLAEALAAGNRAMIKVSEFTPHTSALLQSLFAQYFQPEVVTVVTGGAETGAAFSQLPFDHLFFTGAPTIGRHVQRAAAANLVPVTLELGGKCPVVITAESNLANAAQKVAFGKTLNAGQICLSPDYVFVPQGSEQAFADEIENAITQMFPRLLANQDYCSLISPRHLERLQDILEDAKSKGAKIIEINPAGEDFADQPHCKMAPTLVLNATRDMRVLQEELFGPILPILGYTDVDAVIDWVNSGTRPLATYYFGKQNADCERYLQRTHSGGVVINDVIIHAMVDTLPFGGVGESGMGSYHGQAGFKTFSHAKAVAKAGFFSPGKLMTPPYDRLSGLLHWMLRRELKTIQRRVGKR